MRMRLKDLMQAELALAANVSAMSTICAEIESTLFVLIVDSSGGDILVSRDPTLERMTESLAGQMAASLAGQMAASFSDLKVVSWTDLMVVSLFDLKAASLADLKVVSWFDSKAVSLDQMAVSLASSLAVQMTMSLDQMAASLTSSLDVNMTASLASSLADQMDVILADKMAKSPSRHDNQYLDEMSVHLTADNFLLLHLPGSKGNSRCMK